MRVTKPSAIMVTIIAVVVMVRDREMISSTSGQKRMGVESILQAEDNNDVDHASRINAGTLNRFHLAMITRIIRPMRNVWPLHVRYGGIVGFADGREKLRIEGSIGAPLEWTVFDDDGIGVFSLQISSQRSADTFCSCRLGKETVFVEILGVDGPTKDEKLLNTPRKSLGGRTISQVVILLESDPTKLELKGK